MTSTRVAAGVAVIVTVLLLALPPGVGALRAARPGQPTPEIAGGPWINSAPLTLSGLKGRVVFIEFWTYG